MGTRTKHAPGTFSWVDLATSDGAGAKSFYGDLFGWSFEDHAVGEGSVYTMCKVQGDSVAAISETSTQGPPRWNSYVTVESADETTATAKELGANVAMEPFDVFDNGRMSVLMDPTGAALCVWEPRASIGAERVNDPGCLTWNELHTPDVDAALAFHTGLFGWGSDEMDTQGGPRYIIVKVGERSNGGIMDAQQGEPPNWLPYFVVEDRDSAVERTKGLGGQELIRMDMPQGRIAAVTDPQGAPLALFEGEVDD